MIYILAAARIILCMFPQNGWLSQDPSYMWGIYRNIPFALLGILIVVLFIKEASKIACDPFRFAWLAVTLSFAFYIPVVLFADKIPAIGALMMPKTLSYVWLIWMGYKHYKKQLSL